MKIGLMGVCSNYHRHENKHHNKIFPRTKQEEAFLNPDYETNKTTIIITHVKEKFIELYCKKHEKNKTKVWLEDVFKISVQQTKGEESLISYLYFLGELTQPTFDLIQLLMDWKSIKNELGVN